MTIHHRFARKAALLLVIAAVSLLSIRRGMWLQDATMAGSRSLDTKPPHLVFDEKAAHRQQQPPPQFLIDQASNRSLPTTLPGLLSAEEIAYNYTAFQDQDSSFAPLEEWKKSHIADINIIGLPKAGTSHLYNVLIHHDNFERFHPKIKEKCFFVPSSKAAPTQSKYFIFNNRDPDIQALARRNATADNKLTVNGCLHPQPVMMMRQYLQRVDDSKVIVLLRDPADWAWAAYNFWRRPEHVDALEAGGPAEDWAYPSTQYRSPEHFHEMVRGGERLWTFVELFSKLREGKAYETAALMAAAKRHNPENVLVLKTEDMAPDRVEDSGFLQKLAAFLEVPESSFDKSITGSFSNCGDKRGVKSQCKKSSSAYAIAGNRSMLEETRELIYLHFAEECKFWAEELGIIYQSCLDVREKYNLDH